MAKIQSWGWDMTTLTKKPKDWVEQELPVLDLPASLEPVGFLDVEVIQARNIPRVDILGSADPSVLLLFLRFFCRDFQFSFFCFSFVPFFSWWVPQRLLAG